MIYTMPVGTSVPADFQLYEEGAALVGTGLDIELLLYQDGDLVGGSPALEVAWLDQAAGTVRITGVEGMEVGSYKFRFKLTNGTGGEAFVPSSDSAARWKVVKVQS